MFGVEKVGIQRCKGGDNPVVCGIVCGKGSCFGLRLRANG